MIAAMGRKVVAVDPLIQNLGLIQKSLQMSGKANLVRLLNNPIRYSTM